MANRTLGAVAAGVLLLLALGGCGSSPSTLTRFGNSPTQQGGYVAGRPVIDAVIVEETSVNLRSGPSTRHAVIGGARQGMSLDVLAKKNGWLEVRQGSRTAWVAGWLTRPADAEADTVIAVSPRTRGLESAESRGPAILPDLDEDGETTGEQSSDDDLLPDLSNSMSPDSSGPLPSF